MVVPAEGVIPRTPGKPTEAEAKLVTITPLQERGPIAAQREVEAFVVYLGRNPHMSVYYEGSETEFIGPDGKQHWRSTPSGATAHVFERVDTLGQPVAERLMPDGHPFVKCRSLAHLAKFLRERADDGAPRFEIRCTPDVRQAIEQYLHWQLEQRLRNPDRPALILEAMGLGGTSPEEGGA